MEYSYGPHTTTGVVSKLVTGGGDAVAHSRPVADQGLAVAFRPKKSDRVR